jgi:hypothetical protein
MELSREARVVAGITLIVAPTIMYGGVTLLGILTRGVAGIDPGVALNDTQWSLFRAGTLSRATKWLARVTAPLAAVAISGGFFGLAFIPGFQLLLYLGALSLAVAVLLTGVGLLRRPRVA